MKQEISLSRKRLIFLSVVTLLLIGLITYSVYSLLMWRSYKNKTVDLSRTWIEKLDKVLPVVSSNSNFQTKVGNLREYIDGFEGFELCKTSSLTSWQRVISPVGSLIEQCQTEVAAINELVNKLNSVVSYLENEYALGDIFKNSTSLKSEQEEADWEASANIWKLVCTNIESLKVADEFIETKQTAKAAADGIYVAWQELLNAHKAEDRARFNGARSALVLSYDRLAEIQVVSEDRLNKLTDNLESTYQRLDN